MARAEIMTAEEVAEYLRVSPRTVHDWAQKGEIPCGKIGATWRFKRTEIEAWVNRRLGGAGAPAAPRPVGLDRVLAPERVLILPAPRKVEVLEALIDRLAQTPQCKSREELANGIYHREDLMNTSIGLGIAVPHVRLPSVSDIVLGAAGCREGVPDYESLDDIPVRLVFMIAAGEGQHAQHLKLLSRLSARLKDDALRRRLMEAPDPLSFYRTLVETDRDRPLSAEPANQ